MYRVKNEAANLHYYSDRMQNKLSLLAAAKAAVIEAPSGYGKTTAIRDYLEGAADNGDDIYWFTAIEEAPAALYRRLCREIEKIDARAGEQLCRIDFPNAFTIGEACDALRSIECSRKTWLVVDDFQFFRDILPLPFLAALLECGMDNLRVVIITRALGRELLCFITGRGVLHITASDMRWETGDIRNYFNLSGEAITMQVANEIKNHTDGWIIAVYLQLHAYQETGSFSNVALLQLIENLIWNKITGKQQDFFMRLSLLETCTIHYMCRILGCDTLPDYAAECLSIPFVRYIAEQQRYELHSVLLEFIRIKLRERGAEFEKECIINAGDIFRDESMFAEALALYARVKDYKRILALDLSPFIGAEIGNITFYDIALEITRDSGPDIIRDYPLSMLCVAWAIRQWDDGAAFGGLMKLLDDGLPETGLLRAEWLLLSVYSYFPQLEKMLAAVKKAAPLFGEACSRVILPDAPWAFYEYAQLTAFHTELGAADNEADMLEEFIALYSGLTGGHGRGADALFRAELAYFRCETTKAEIYAYRAVFLSEAKAQKIIQIGAARLLSAIALLKDDADGWQRAVSALEIAASGPAQNTSIFRALLDVVRGTVQAELSNFAPIADWLKNTDFTSRRLPSSILADALTVHALYLLGNGDFARLVGLAHSLSTDKYTIFAEHMHLLFLAAAFSLLDDRKHAGMCLFDAAKKALPDGLLHVIAGLSTLLQGLADELIEKSYPQYFALYKDYKEHYISCWYSLHKTIVADELPSALTEREREIAILAADGLHNYEIAEMLFVSENTVRAHLRTIYQKLDIDRRAKLAKKLK